jgi:hypothetical protein
MLSYFERFVAAMEDMNVALKRAGDSARGGGPEKSG